MKIQLGARPSWLGRPEILVLSTIVFFSPKFQNRFIVSFIRFRCVSYRDNRNVESDLFGRIFLFLFRRPYRVLIVPTTTVNILKVLKLSIMMVKNQSLQNLMIILGIFLTEKALIKSPIWSTILMIVRGSKRKLSFRHQEQIFQQVKTLF